MQMKAASGAVTPGYPFRSIGVTALNLRRVASLAFTVTGYPSFPHLHEENRGK